MAVQPKPLRYRCPQCGWRKTQHFQSDVLSPSDFLPKNCPKCAHAELAVERLPESETQRILSQASRRPEEAGKAQQGKTWRDWFKF